MFKSVIKLTALLLLLLFSFVYTNKVFEEARNTNPVMKEIKKYKRKNDIKAVEPILNGNELIVGLSGIVVDKNESYNNMKDNFDKNKIVVKKVLPKKSITKNNSYYIIKGNGSKKEVAIIFKIKNNDNYEKFINYDRNNKNNFTLFIDGKYLEDNPDKIYDYKNKYEIYNLGYNEKYDNNISDTNRLIKSITLKKSNYCLNETKNKEYKKVCDRKNMISITPKIINPSISDLKKKIENGSIISYDLDNINISNLNIIINIIESKGYKIVSLSKLIKE